MSSALLEKLKPLIGQVIDLYDYDLTLSSRVDAVAKSLERHIFVNRLKSGRSTQDAELLARKSVLSEVATTKRVSDLLGEPAKWASEHEVFRGPYDIILGSSMIDVKCGAPDSTITFMKSERDKVWRQPQFENVIHIRNSWCDDNRLMTVTHVYLARAQPWEWSPKNNEEGVEEHEMTYYIKQKDIR